MELREEVVRTTQRGMSGGGGQRLIWGKESKKGRGVEAPGDMLQGLGNKKQRSKESRWEGKPPTQPEPYSKDLLQDLVWGGQGANICNW